MTVLEFREKSHKYYLDGKWAPGVTTIIGGGVPKGGLDRWYARTAAEFARDNWATLNPESPDFINKVAGAPENTRDTAAARGTAIHAAGEELVTSGEVTVAGHLDEIQHYADWLEKWEIKPLLVERQCFSRNPRHCGTFDLLAQSRFINNGKPFIADLKTSRSVYGDVALQLSAYAMSEKYIDKDGGDKLMPFVDYAMVVHIRADGVDAHPVCISREEIEEAYDWFKSAYVTYSNKTARKNRLRDPLVKQPLEFYDRLKGAS